MMQSEMRRAMRVVLLWSFGYAGDENSCLKVDESEVELGELTERLSEKGDVNAAGRGRLEPTDCSCDHALHPATSQAFSTWQKAEVFQCAPS
jgi:hypothetical protein